MYGALYLVCVHVTIVVLISIFTLHCVKSVDVDSSYCITEVLYSIRGLETPYFHCPISYVDWQIIVGEIMI